MKNIAAAVLVVGLGLSALAIQGIGQAPVNAPKYIPTDKQTLEIHAVLRDVQYTQTVATAADQAAQQAIQTAKSTLAEVPIENKWPTTVTYSIDWGAATTTYVDAPAPPAPVVTKPEPPVNHTPAATPAPAPKPATPAKP